MPPAPAPSIKPDVPVAAAASQLDTKRKRTPAYRWDANGCEKIWELIAILEDDDFRKVIFGKADADDNTSGESKTSVFKRMALKLFPDEATDAPPAKMTELGNRVKNKYEALSKEYKRQAAKFYYTGNGIDGEGGVEVEDGILRFYISPEGPDHDTPSDAQNLWDSVCKEFPFYEALHRILAAKANIVPINITRGVGPQGAVTIYPQEPSDTEDTPAPPSHIPPATLNPVPIYREAPTTDLPNLLENGWDSLNQDIATFLKEFPSTQSADAPTIHAPLMNAPALHVPLANQESQVPVNKASVSAVTKKSDAKPTQVSGNKSGNKNSKRKKTEPNTPKPSLSVATLQKAARKAKAPKLSLEDRLISITEATQRNLQADRARNTLIEERKMLAQEFDRGIVTKEEYREARERIQAKMSELDDEINLTSQKKDDGILSLRRAANTRASSSSDGVDLDDTNLSTSSEDEDEEELELPSKYRKVSK